VTPCARTDSTCSKLCLTRLCIHEILFQRSPSRWCRTRQLYKIRLEPAKASSDEIRLGLAKFFFFFSSFFKPSLFIVLRCRFWHLLLLFTYFILTLTRMQKPILNPRNDRAMRSVIQDQHFKELAKLIILTMSSTRVGPQRTLKPEVGTKGASSLIPAGRWGREPMCAFNCSSGGRLHQRSRGVRRTCAYIA
jgi:hypothetical protein